jgi:membrane-associated protein
MIIVLDMVRRMTMPFIFAFFAINNPDLVPVFFVIVFFAGLINDHFFFLLGRYVAGNSGKLYLIKKRFFPHENMEDYDNYLKFGPLSLIIGRFIPFGIGNILFFSIGVSKHKILDFLIVDTFAAFLTTLVYFYFGYKFGKPFIEGVKQGNIFIIVAIILFFMLSILYKKKKLTQKSSVA